MEVEVGVGDGDGGSETSEIDWVIASRKGRSEVFAGGTEVGAVVVERKGAAERMSGLGVGGGVGGCGVEQQELSSGRRGGEKRGRDEERERKRDREDSGVGKMKQPSSVL